MKNRSRILIVDDDGSARKTLTLILNEKGYETETAGTGQEAIEKAWERFFNVAFLDIRLPDVTGVELLAPLRDIHPDMASIIVTGYSSVQTAVRALNEGASAYVTKPLNVDEVLTRVEQALERQRLLDEKRQAEQALRESEERYRTLFEGVPVGLYRTTPEGRILHANRALVEMLGYPDRPTLMQVNVNDLYVDPEERQREEDLLEREGIVRGFELRLRRHDGGVIWARDTVRAACSVSRSVVYYEGSLEDVTARKRAEEERERLIAQIRGQARELKQIMDTVPEGVLLLDAEGRVLQANPVAGKDLMVLADAEVGDIITRLGDRPLAELLTSPPKGLWHEVKADKRTFEVIARLMEPDPMGRQVQHDGSPDGNGPEAEHWVLVINDVTREREMEGQLHRHERLAAVGRLAGGIAHDFNNFLTTIILYANLLKGKYSSPDQVASVETIISEAGQAASLVEQILDFSRRSTMETRAVDLVGFTEEVSEILRQTIPESIHFELAMEPETCIIQADPTRIQQVLVNLALNARDAMLAEDSAEGGRLRISLSKLMVAPGEEPPVAEMSPGDWVCLGVSDTGIGMTEEIQAHLFEPFFTTKEAGKGTGLGLAQVYGIVKQHRGHIDVDTELGRGTTFWVYLPAHAAAGAEETEREDTSLVPQGKDEMILLVEDQEGVREAGREILSSLGYHVLTASNGQEALEIVQGLLVDLVITDVVMPEMGGKALLERLKKIAPDLKVLAITGYAQEKGDSLEEGFVDLIHKPFDAPILAQVVRRALDVR